MKVSQNIKKRILVHQPPTMLINKLITKLLINEIKFDSDAKCCFQSSKYQYGNDFFLYGNEDMEQT